jgi:hypothetical protein
MSHFTWSVLLAAVAVLFQPQEEYCNERFDFCLQYPVGFFDRIEPSDNADGVRLLAGGQDIELTISGSNNVLQWTLDDMRQLQKEVIAEDFGAVQNLSEKPGPGYVEFRFLAAGATHLHRIYHREDEIVFLRIRAGRQTQPEVLAKLLSELVVQFNP